MVGGLCNHASIVAFIRMEIFSFPPPRFRVFALDSQSEPAACVAEYDTVAQALRHKWPIKGDFKIEVDGQMMTSLEFAHWAKREKRTWIRT